MSKFVSDLLEGVKARPALDLDADPLAAYAAVAADARKVGKSPVEQEFPGLASIGMLPHFMMPGLVFYHEPTGYIVYGGLSMLPGLSPLGQQWLGVPVVVRYPATQRFTPEAAVAAIRGTFLQSVVLPQFGKDKVKSGTVLHALRIILGDEADAYEVAPGVFETYALMCMEADVNTASATIDAFSVLIEKFNSTN